MFYGLDVAKKVRKRKSHRFGVPIGCSVVDIHALGRLVLIGSKLNRLFGREVHKTHYDIFGFYYPPEFKNWCAARYQLPLHRRAVSTPPRP